MTLLSSLAVFCGSRMGENPRHREAAQTLGQRMGERGIQLVYGSGGIGLMSEVAQATLSAGGEVRGVIPAFLRAYEVGAVEGVHEEVVESMHERKARMFELADAFAILPGGLGTLDETLEIMTWKQLQQHAKPIVFINIDGYWDPLLATIDRVVEGGYGHHKVRELYMVVDNVEDVFNAIARAPEPDDVVLTSHL